MTTFQQLRLYHAALAILAIAVYATGELGLIHAWLGYALAALIAFRVAWGLVGPRQISLSKFVPKLSDVGRIASPDHPAIGKTLLAGVAISLLLATFTGIALDQPSLVGDGARDPASSVAAVYPADPINTSAVIRAGFDFGEESGEREEGWIGELHEATANLFLIFVGLHVAYLLLFKRNFALFMLFRKTSAAERP
jgi:cytochrome b